MVARIDQRDLKRRHPLCPACGYDLVATLAADKRVCPECGEGFSPSQLDWERRPGDWTALTAIRFGVRALATRTILAMMAATLLSAATLWLADHDAPRFATFAVALIQIVALGWVISRRLQEDAGFESMLLTVGACAAAVIAAGFGAMLANSLVDTPKGALVLIMHMGISVVGAWAWIAYHLVMDAQ